MSLTKRNKKKTPVADKYIFILNIIVVIALLLNYLLSTNYPRESWFLVFSGYKVSYLLIINTIFMLYWFIRLRLYFIVSALCIGAYVLILFNSFGVHRKLLISKTTTESTEAYQMDEQKNYIAKDAQVPDHPRLLMLKGDEDLIKKKIASDENLARLNQIILSESDMMLNQTVTQNLKQGRRLLDKSRDGLRRLFFLSYAYRITGSQKYLEGAKNEMLTVCSFDDWNPTHFLDVAEMCAGVSIAYDWLYNDLPETYRLIIRKAILTKALQPSLNPKYNYWLKQDNNWNQVCNAGMLYGALAIYEDNQELAQNIIDRSISSIQVSMAQYAPNGTYNEGFVYWHYGTNFNVMEIAALKKAFNSDFGLTAKPGFLSTPLYLQNLVGTSGEAFNYSDSDDENTELSPSAAMFWFANQLNNPSLLWTERGALTNPNAKVVGKNRLLPAVLLFAGDTHNITEPQNKVWVANGKNPEATLRTSWGANGIFVGLKAGSPSAGHGHMDAGSFVMDALGERWAMDLGAENYNRLEQKGLNIWDMKQGSQRWQVFRYSNFSHNTLTVDSTLQNVDAAARIVSSSSRPDFLNAVTDLTDIYRGSLVKATRGAAIINQNYVAIKDEFETSAKTENVKWVMVTPANVQIVGKNKAQLTLHGKQLNLQAPADVTLTTAPAYAHNSYETLNRGKTIISFSVNVPANTKKSITVLLSPQNTAATSGKESVPLQQWPLN